MLIKNENIEKLLNNEQSTSYILKVNSKGDIEVVNRYSFSTYLGRLFAFVTRKDTYKLKKIVEVFPHLTFENQQLQQDMATKLNGRISHYNANHPDKEQLFNILTPEPEEVTIIKEKKIYPITEEDEVEDSSLNVRPQIQVKIEDSHFNLSDSTIQKNFSTRLYVMDLTGKYYGLYMPNNKELTVGEFLNYVATEINKSVNSFRIIYAGKLIGKNPDEYKNPLINYGVYESGRVHLVLKLGENLGKYLDPVLEGFCRNPDYIRSGKQSYKDMESLDTALISIISRISRGKLDRNPLKELTAMREFLTVFTNKIEQLPENADRQEAIDYLTSFQGIIQSAESLYKRLKEKLDLSGPSDKVLKEALDKYPKIDVSCQPDREMAKLQVQEKTYQFDRQNLLDTIGYLKGNDNFTKNQETFEIPKKDVDPAVLTYVIQFMLEEAKLSFADLEDKDLLNLYTHIQYLEIPRLEALCAKEIVNRIMQNPEESIEGEFYNIYMTSAGTYLGQMLAGTPFEQVYKVNDQILRETLKLYPKINVAHQPSKPTIKITVGKKEYTLDRENLLETIGYLKTLDNFTKYQKSGEILELTPEMLEDVDIAGLAYVIQFMTEEDKLSFIDLNNLELLNLYAQVKILIIPRLEALCAQEIVKRLMEHPGQGIDRGFYEVHVKEEETCLGKMLKNITFA